MENNPFYDASILVSNERLSDKLMEAAVMWDWLTDSGKNASDADVYSIISGYGFEDILVKYEIYRKKENEFDYGALKQAVDDWILEV